MYNYEIEVDYDIKSDHPEIHNKYQELYLKTMNLEAFDNKRINEIYDDLLKKIENTSYFKPIFSLELNTPIFNDNWTKLLLMFSFLSFKYMHICLKEFFTLNKVSQENLANLKSSLEYLVKK